MAAVVVSLEVCGVDCALTGPLDFDWPISGPLFLGLALPVTNIHRCETCWSRRLQSAIAAGLGILAVATTITAGLDNDVAESLIPATAWALVLSTWTGALLAGATVKRGPRR